RSGSPRRGSTDADGAEDLAVRPGQGRARPEGVRGRRAGSSAPSASVLPLLGLPLRDRDGLPVELRSAILPGDERVAHVVLVVPARIVVRACMSSTALLAREAR